MILPPDNDYDLDLEAALDPLDLPAPTVQDVTNLLPGWAQDPSSPVRDALMGSVAAVANRQWSKNGQAIVRLMSPEFADGAWLDYWGSLLKRPRVANEEDGLYRARLLSSPDRISPNAIQAAVKADVAVYTEVLPVFEEPATDGPFISHVGSPWRAYIQPSKGRIWATYPDDVTCPTPGGYIVPAIGTTASGSAPVVHVSGAVFFVILPGAALFGLGEKFIVPRVLPGGWTVNDEVFINPVTFPPSWVLASDLATVDISGPSLAQQVVSDVEFRKAAGPTWLLIIDPYLSKAV